MPELGDGAVGADWVTLGNLRRRRGSTRRWCSWWWRDERHEDVSDKRQVRLSLNTRCYSAAALDLGAELFEVEVALDPVKRVVPDGAAIAQVDDRQPLGLDDLAAQPVVGGNMVAVKIGGVEGLRQVLQHVLVAVAQLGGEARRQPGLAR